MNNKTCMIEEEEKEDEIDTQYIEPPQTDKYDEINFDILGSKSREYGIEFFQCDDEEFDGCLI